MPAWITTLLAVAGGIATLSGAIVAVKQVAPVLQTIIGVFNDFAGEPARPGVDARPGVIETLALIKHTQLDQGKELADIKKTQTEQGLQIFKVQHELHPNSGLSLRDAVDRLEEAAGITKPEAPVVNVNVTAVSSSTQP